MSCVLDVKRMLHEIVVMPVLMYGTKPEVYGSLFLRGMFVSVAFNDFFKLDGWYWRKLGFV